MSDELSPITDFRELRKIVNAGTVILQQVTIDPNIWGDDKRRVTTVIGAVTSVEIIERGAVASTVAIWIKDRPEPLFLSTPGRDEPFPDLSYRTLSGGY